MHKKPREEFILPTTIAGMLFRTNVLNEEIKAIEEQLGSTAFRMSIPKEDDYQIWRKKAIMARLWKVHERAWLVEHYNVAIKDDNQKKRARLAQQTEEYAIANERRRQRLEEWIETHQDDEFTKLFAELYEIVKSIDQTDDESVFDDHEIEVIRTARDYLKKKGVYVK